MYFYYNFYSTYSKFNDFIKLNRWEYDPERIIPIESMNPQKSRKYDKVNTLPKEQVITEEQFSSDAYGKAAGSRIEDSTGNVKSVRLLGKKAATGGVNNSCGEIAASTRNVGTKNKRKTLKTTAPIWTTKTRNALTKEIQKCKGKASNKGIAWARVVEKMHISRHYCEKEWKRLEEERAVLSSSSVESSDDEQEESPPAKPRARKGRKDVRAGNSGKKDDKTGKGGKEDDRTKKGGKQDDKSGKGDKDDSPCVQEVVPSLFESQMIALMNEQTRQLKELTESNSRLLKDNARLSKATSSLQSDLSKMEHQFARDDSASDSSNKKSKRRRSQPRRKKSKRFNEDDLIRFQNASSQADVICSLSKENDRLRLLK